MADRPSLGAIPAGLFGGVIVWVLAQGIALGPTGAIVVANSPRALLLTVPNAPGLLLAYTAAGVLEETEFRGILLGQLAARLRGARGAGIASVVALLASTAVFALLHIPSFASFGWTDMRLLPSALQEVTLMGLALGLCYLLTGNLFFAMVVHALFDSAELVLLGRVDGPVAHPFIAAGLIVALAWGALRWLHLRRQMDDRLSQNELGMGGLLVWLGIFGVALAGLEQLAGWPVQPPLPDHWPSWAFIQVWLNSPLAGLGTLVPVALDIGWVVWALTAASILLQALVDLLDAATRGAAWVRSLRLATNLLVLPPIRRAVDASLGGLLLTRVLVQPAAFVEASSMPTSAIVMLAPAPARPAPSSGFIAGEIGVCSAEIAAPAIDGPRSGVRLLAASEGAVAELLSICPFIDQFGTRLVLQTASEEDSVALLGMPGAEYLGAGGLAFLRLEGRLPVQGWTRHVSADRLARLVHMMGTRAPAVRAQSDDDPVVSIVEPTKSGEPKENGADAQAINDATQGTGRPRAGSQLAHRLRSAPIRVRCFGAGDAWYGDRLLEISDPELLLLLAVHPVTGIQNEALSDMLWDETPPDPKAALRKTRYNLRSELRRLAPEVTADPLPGNQTHGEKVVFLDTSVVSSDIHEFTELLQCAEKQEPAAAIETYEAALALYRGDLLDGPNVPSYRWLYDEDRRSR